MTGHDQPQETAASTVRPDLIVRRIRDDAHGARELGHALQWLAGQVRNGTAGQPGDPAEADAIDAQAQALLGAADFATNLEHTVAHPAAHAATVDQFRADQANAATGRAPDGRAAPTPPDADVASGSTAQSGEA